MVGTAPVYNIVVKRQACRFNGCVTFEFNEGCILNV